MFKLLAAICVLGCAVAYPTGAPEQSCGNLSPGHGVDFQPFDASYTITAQGSSGGVYNVKLSGPTFKGYIMQAFLPDGKTPVGTFTVTGTSDQVICQGAGVTHTSSKPVTQVNVQWRGPQGTEVYFKATVVQNYSTVFGNIASGSLVA